MRLPAALLALLLTAAAVSQADPCPRRQFTDASVHGGLAAHKALYTLSLVRSKGGEIVAARGTMGYEVTDACDGWAVRQRLKLNITNSEGQEIVMTSDYATWEAKNGLKFRFHVRQTTDEAVTSQTDGDASLSKLGGAGEARYTSPHAQTIPLPAATIVPHDAHRSDRCGREGQEALSGAAACLMGRMRQARKTASSLSSTGIRHPQPSGPRCRPYRARGSPVLF